MKFFRPSLPQAPSIPTSSLTPDLGRIQPIRWSWFGLEGPDARDFLHRLSTVDVRQLAVGKGAPGCFLTPQGKIRATFFLWRDAAERYSFEFDPGEGQAWKSQILAFIDQYTFGEKMSVVEPPESQECLWLFPSEVSELESLGVAEIQSRQRIQLNDEIWVCCREDFELGRTWLTLWGPAQELSKYFQERFPRASELTLEQVETWRIRQMSPRVGFEITEGASPLDVGLRQSIADQKGCYPGQEVIEKVISIGSPPRRLARIEAIGAAPAVGDLIFDQESGAEVGVVTSSVGPSSSEMDRSQILGLIKKTFSKKEGAEVRFSSSQNRVGVIMQIAPYE